MGKAEKGTPKYLANKMKAKGLQKLRWYCQMCQKQCRDENGFKCHTMSESHQRQLLLFAESPHKYLDSFSQEFEETYMELLRRRYGTKRVNANQVYQEVIKEKNHIHMNATIWITLTGFVKHLGRAGKVVADLTEKGWFLTYVDRDPDTIARQEALAKKKKMDKDDEERLLDFIEKQVERGKQNGDEDPEEAKYTELKRSGDEEAPIKLDLNLGEIAKAAKRPPLKFEDVLSAPSSSSSPGVFKKPKIEPRAEEKKHSKADVKPNALAEIMAENEARKDKQNRKDVWITEGIIVKIMAKSLGDQYYRKKGAIIQVGSTKNPDLRDPYTAVVKMNDSGGRIKLDQAHLETVIPNIGRLVKIVNGSYRGEEAVLKAINEKSFSTTVEIKGGLYRGKVLERVPYEDICKKADS